MDAWVNGHQGVIKNDRFGKFSNGFTYVFKYLIKTISISRYPELSDTDTISDIGNKSTRTMLYASRQQVLQNA